MSALDTAIRATERNEQHRGDTRITRTSYNERRCTSKNFSLQASVVGETERSEGCHYSQASHFSGGFSTDQSSKSGEMVEVEAARLIISVPARIYLPSLRGHSDLS